MVAVSKETVKEKLLAAFAIAVFEMLIFSLVFFATIFYVNAHALSPPSPDPSEFIPYVEDPWHDGERQTPKLE